MLKKCAVTALAVVSTMAISGCNSQTNNLFRKPNSGPVPPAAAATPPPPVQPNPAAPYVLSAQSAGPFIDFNIYNLGTTDLVVEKDDFAIISQENRQVTPYTPESTIIDLPQPAVIKPNSTLDGRAIFKEVKSPIGKRLVFKPDEIGTFADINPISVTK